MEDVTISETKTETYLTKMQTYSKDDTNIVWGYTMPLWQLIRMIRRVQLPQKNSEGSEWNSIDELAFN